MSNRSIEKIMEMEKDPKLKFEVYLNQYYSELCYSIRKRKSWIHNHLDRTVSWIYQNLKYLKYLSNEDRYMIFNTIKLAKTIDDEIALKVQDSEIYQKLEEEYKNSR